MSDAVAPLLSTYQDEITFQKYEEFKHQRPHLGPNTNLNESIREYYSIDELIQFLKKEHHGVRMHKKVTLQFPDSLVSDSAIVVQLLQEGLGFRSQEVDAVDHTTEESCKKSCETCKCSNPEEISTKQHVWILADTAYSSCCIDEVAAGHVGSDLVIHFGDACLNAIQKLDSVYVFGKPYLEHQPIVEKFREIYQQDDKVILMADCPNTRHLPRLYDLLKPEYPNLGYADIDLSKAHNSQIIGFQSSPHYSSTSFSNRIIKGQDADEGELKEYQLFHLTEPQPPHLLYLSTQFSSMTLYEPRDNSTNSGPFPSLMKRYRYMQMARTAGTIGILVNTLSLRNTNDVIKEVSRKIKEAGKKHYMFVVGKPNVAKLANFESIEVWCILGCGQGGLILDQTNEFYKPIVTPYELELSLNPMIKWTGDWITQFDKLLDQDDESNDESTAAESHRDKTLEGEDEAPEFNAVTGKFVSTSRPLRAIQHLEIQPSKDENQLVNAFSKTVAIKGTVSTSAAYLQNREWTGLGSDFTDIGDEGALVEEGRDGVARGYDYDVNH
jgi:diphthamide biosynthesis protein 2